MRKLIKKRYLEGAIVIGLSAGAIQLGLKGYTEESKPVEVFPTFGLVPYIIATREIPSCPKLTEVLLSCPSATEGDRTKGIAIAAGGGVMYYRDRFVEAVGKDAMVCVGEAN